MHNIRQIQNIFHLAAFVTYAETARDKSVSTVYTWQNFVKQRHQFAVSVFVWQKTSINIPRRQFETERTHFNSN